MKVSRLLIENFRETKVVNSLKSFGVERKDDEKDLKLEDWLTKIIEDGRVSADIVNNCIWDELMYGHRRYMRVYEIKAIRKIKHDEDWKDFLEKYDCPEMNFNRIIQTKLQSNEKLKVCGMQTEYEEDKIKTVHILFVYNMEMYFKSNNSYGNFNSYIPVTIDLKKKLLIMKIWNKDDANTGDLPREQLDYVLDRLLRKLEFEIKAISVDPQCVLYKMSRALFNEFFMHLPNNKDVEDKRQTLPELIDNLLDGISLENKEVVDGLKTMNPEVIDIKEELYKLVQQVALYDYLKDNDIKELLDNTDRYISRIRFSDRDNLTASLISETGNKCIFDAKTFMCVRNSLDLVAKIVSIVVSFTDNSGRGLLSVKYDASDRQYLNIHILNTRYYTKEDFEMIWGLYERYESDNAEANALYIEDDAEAM